MDSSVARVAAASVLARRIDATVHARMPIAASVKSMPTMPPTEYAWPSMKVRYATGMLVAAVRKRYKDWLFVRLSVFHNRGPAAMGRGTVRRQTTVTRVFAENDYSIQK
jgi:hypothetical protein